MSIIEQAARRLEELRRSGVDVPGMGATAAGPRSVQIPLRADPQRPTVREIAPAAVRPAAKASKHVQIDLDRLAEMGYLTPDTPRAQIADEFRVIKRPLLENVYGKSAAAIDRANLLMVTSSLPGEGKTFVSLNLAISMAMELDTTVLLVDADVSRPAVLSRLGLPSAPGLLDILADPSIQLHDVLLRTNIKKLSILPAGTSNGHATEMLASEGMNRLLEELATRYPDRVLVFDAPPLLPSTESRVLATHMGQVVVVVEAEKTAQKDFAQAMATLESCPVVMPLLNKTSKSEVGSYYGYYGPLTG